MEFRVVHRAGIKHQGVDALSRLFTIGEDRTPFDEALPGILVVSSPKEDRKVGTTCTEVIEEDDKGFSFIPMGLSDMQSVVTPEPETNTNAPTLARLSGEKAKDEFCRQVAATVRMSSLHY